MVDLAVNGEEVPSDLPRASSITIGRTESLDSKAPMCLIFLDEASKPFSIAYLTLQQVAGIQSQLSLALIAVLEDRGLLTEPN